MGHSATSLQRSLGVEDLCDVDDNAFLRVALLAKKRSELRRRRNRSGEGAGEEGGGV